MKKIIAHCLVRNESRFIWYSINSILPFVDRILIYDTGSTDNTLKIIESIDSKKITLKKKKVVNKNEFTNLRQQMIDDSKGYDWMMILDGDEIWPSQSIKQVINAINKIKSLETIVVKTNNLVGDIYHRSFDFLGKYRFKGITGHLALRFINLSIDGLHAGLPYGQEGYFDKNQVLVQDRDSNKQLVLDVFYHHATHLRRSSISKDKETMQRKNKFKYLLGKKIKSSQIPEIFNEKRPLIVPSVTQRRSLGYLLISSLVTPLVIIKNLLNE